MADRSLKVVPFGKIKLLLAKSRMRSLPSILLLPGRHGTSSSKLIVCSAATMEKIKAALHIRDKTAVPGDGAVGNMQNPGSEAGPTSEELWGAGNAETKHHLSHKGDTVAAAAAESSKASLGSELIAMLFAS